MLFWLNFKSDKTWKGQYEEAKKLGRLLLGLWTTGSTSSTSIDWPWSSGRDLRGLPGRLTPSWASRTFPASMYYRGIKKGDAIKLPSRRTLFWARCSFCTLECLRCLYPSTISPLVFRLASSVWADLTMVLKQCSQHQMLNKLHRYLYHKKRLETTVSYHAPSRERTWAKQLPAILQVLGMPSHSFHMATD